MKNIHHLFLIGLTATPFAQEIIAQTNELPLVEIRAKSALESVVDSTPLPASKGLNERIAALPSMRVDMEGRLKWRGTDEFRIDFDGIPLDRNLLESFPSSLSADIETDPQADASQNSSGMTGWIHLSPKLLRQSSYIEVQAGAGLPGREWAGAQGAIVNQGFKLWSQAHHQARSELRQEKWESKTWTRNLEWRDRELRNFALLGTGYSNAITQIEIEGWANQADLIKAYSRIKTDSSQQNDLWNPENNVDLRAASARWGLKLGEFKLKSQVDGLLSQIKQDWTGGGTSEDRRYSKGLLEFAYDFNGLTTNFGAEHSWDGRDFSQDGLWQEIQDAAYLQASQKIADYRVEAGLRIENTDRTSADHGYDQSDLRYLPSGGVYAELPWYGAEVYGRYSYRVEYPDAALLIPGQRKISPFEGRIGDKNLLAEEIHGTEFGVGIPFPTLKAKFEVKAFSALADNMLLRNWTWQGDTAYLQIQNGLSENRRGGEISWQQEFESAKLNFDAGAWIEDRETTGPKSEIFGGTGKVIYQYFFAHHLDALLSLSWTGPSFESEGEADPYFEQSLVVGWKPIRDLRIELGAESLFGDDRSLSQEDASGQSWTRTRLSNGPRIWSGLKWSLGL